MEYRITREENLARKESPFLDGRVASGQLPPLQERIPANPRVVEVERELGTYGGTWRRYHLYPDMRSLRLINNYFGLTRWSTETDEILPNLASEWEFNESGTEVTFHLRPGTRWSDGTPFTTADIAFWWEVANDDRTSEIPPEWAFSGGKRMEVELPDDYTIIFKYDEPFYTLPVVMATGFWVPEILIRPSHYLRQFHPDHNPQYTDFTTFEQRWGDVNDPNRPTLAPWMITFRSGTGDRVVLERNPYYWAVDTEGRQLPYIDRIESFYVQSEETGVLMILSGIIDAQFRYIARQDYALINRFRDQHDYDVLRWEEGTGALFAIVFNMEHVDEERGELLRNRNLRKAMAYAIDREFINQVIWGGLSRPQGATITDESWHFHSERGQEVLERWRNAWSEYDPERANRLLDESPFHQRGRDGFRLLDGQPFSLIMDVQDWPLAMDQAILLQAMFEKVGLRVHLQRDIGGRREHRIAEAIYDVYMQHMSEMDLFTFPGYVFPVSPYHWHPRTGRWYATGGEEGIPPEGWTRELMELYDATRREPDLERRHQLVLDAIEIQLREGPFILGTTGRQFSPVIIRRNFRNVPDSGIIGPWAITQPASKNPEQFFIDVYRDIPTTPDLQLAGSRGEGLPR